MNKKGPIVLVEDDPDDQYFLKVTLKKINVTNELIFFNDGLAAYNYLQGNNVHPFLIISDINMPRMNGIELRDKVQQEGRPELRAIPFLFLTTAAAKDTTIQAYNYAVQGFFTKANDIVSYKNLLTRILDYWSVCTAPRFAM